MPQSSPAFLRRLLQGGAYKAKSLLLSILLPSLTAPLSAQFSWTSPTNASNLTSPATIASGDHFHVDASNTAHTLSIAILGSGSPQLVHTRKPSGGAWSTPVLVSAAGSSASGLTIADTESLLDSGGLLHVWFAKIGASGVRQLFHTSLDTSSPSANWTSPASLSAATAPANTLRVFVDANRTAHAFFKQSVGGSFASVHHCFKQIGSASWSSPALISPPSIGSDASIQRQVVSVGSKLHLAFEQAAAGSQISTWHASIDTTTLGAWTTPVTAGPAAGGVAVQTERFLSDSFGNVHLFYTTSPGGTLQLLHNFMPSTGAWSTSRIVSSAGVQPVTVVPNFAADNGQGTLYCIYQQVAGGSGVSQVFLTTLATASPSANWSTPVDVSQATQPATGRSLLVDTQRLPHIFWTAIPSTGSTSQIHHRQLLASGQLGSTTVITGNTGAASIVNSESFQAGLDGRLHVCFEQIPAGQSVQQVFWTNFYTSSPTSPWPTPTFRSNGAQPAFLARLFLDRNHQPNIFYLSIPGTGASQLHHTSQLQTGGFSTPVVISSGGGGQPVTVPAASIRSGPLGVIHAWWEQLLPSTGPQAVWHASLDVGVSDLTLINTSITNSTPIQTQASFVQFTIRNVGTFTSPPTVARVFLKSHSGPASQVSDFVIGEYATGSMPASTQFTYNVPVPFSRELCAGRTWHIDVVLDPDGLVLESNEGNNLQSFPINPQWYPLTNPSPGYLIGKLNPSLKTSDPNSRFGVCSLCVGSLPPGTIAMFVMGCSGQVPGTMLTPSLTLPLQVDACTSIALGFFGNEFINMFGAQVSAPATLDGFVQSPPGSGIPSAIGLPVFLAAAYFDPSFQFIGVSDMSISMPIIF